MDTLWTWVIELPKTFLPFFEWLTTPLPEIGFTPLALFGIGGITLVIAFSIVRLVIGG